MATEPNNNVVSLVTTEDRGPAILTIRMVMQGKEAGSIIGKKGDNVKRFREETGARINISDSSCPERIVTITGRMEQIVYTFTLICRRFEEDLQNASPSSSTPTKQLITLRLIVPAIQCGSLIGKGGAKIKEIRDVAGASIQISSEMLPNSTERLVTISGSVDSVTRGISHICSVMLESPVKGTIIPYRPKPTTAAPIIIAGGQDYSLPGQYIIPQTDPRLSQAGAQTMIQYHSFAKMPTQQGMIQAQQAIMGTQTIMGQQTLMGQQNMMGQQNVMGQPNVMGQQNVMGQPNVMGQQNVMGQPISVYASQQTLIALPYHALASGGYLQASPPANVIQPMQAAQTHQIAIPNELIGCIIGRGGSKINEIRQLSGASIKIASSEDGCSERTVTISGIPEAVNAAQYLINASLEMHKSLTNLNVDQNSHSPASMSAMSSMNVATMSSTGMASPNTVDMSVMPSNSSSIGLNTNVHPASSQQLTLQTAPVSINPLPPTPAAINPLPAPIAIPINSYFKPMSVFNYSNFFGPTYYDPRCNLATKIKGGVALAATRNGFKFSPY